MTALRIAFLLPAFADFLLAALTLLRIPGVDDDSVVPRLQIAAVAIAWGVMLLVAVTRPTERVWVLFPTAIAVAGVTGAICYGYLTGVVGWTSVLMAIFIAFATFYLAAMGLRFAREEARLARPEVAG